MSRIGNCRKRYRGACHSFLVALALTLSLTASSARADSWVPVGAPGGNVRALAQDPRDPERVYLGTAEGILYVSDDGGQRWHRRTPGFPLRGCSLDEIVVNPRGVLFVGYWEVHGRGGGVARSNDGGETFVLLKGIKGESVRALALAPSNPKVIAAGTLTGVFLSRDAGQSWTRITPKDHPDLRNVESLVFDPSDPRVLYAGTWHLGWKTLDGGAAWAPVHQGMIDDSDVMTLTVDRRHPRTLYATACSGIYRSTEGAKRWTKLRGIPYSSRRTRAFAQDEEDASLLFAGTTEGLWVSEDTGGTWSLMTPKDLVVNAVLPLPGGTVLLGTEEAGVLRSRDRGRTWVASNTGFSERFVSKMLFDASGQRLVVAVWGATRYGGVFVSSGPRGPWVRPGDGLEGRQVLSLALMGSTILAGTDDGIFALTQESRAWARLSTRIDGREAHPRVTEMVSPRAGTVVAATTTGVIRSFDEGLTWTQPKIGASEAYGLSAAPGDPRLIVAATGSGFFRSDDGGKIWRQVSSAMKGVTPHAIAFNPSDDRVLFATTTGGLYRSSDTGASWRRMNGGIPHSDLTGIAVSEDGRTIYTSDFGRGGIFRSIDGGATWDRMSTEGLGSDRVWALAIDPAAPDELLAAASAGGLHLLVPTAVATRASAGQLPR